MKARLRYAVALVAILLPVLTGCGAVLDARMSKTCRAWEGHHKSEIIDAWGPPTRTTDDGKGNEILTWHFDKGSFHACDYVDVAMYEQYHFWVNEDGRIYRWRWRRQ
jgi:hypothetical protein